MFCRLHSTTNTLLTGILVTVLLGGSGSLVGCATIVSDGGGDRPLFVSSTPEGASVYVKHGMMDWQKQPGLTPTTIMLDPTKGDYQLKLELDGYEPVTGYVASEIDPWLIGSLALLAVFIVPGIVATAIDFASGAWKKLDPEQIHFSFEKP